MLLGRSEELRSALGPFWCAPERSGTVLGRSGTLWCILGLSEPLLGLSEVSWSFLGLSGFFWAKSLLGYFWNAFEQLQGSCEGSWKAFGVLLVGFWLAFGQLLMKF